MNNSLETSRIVTGSLFIIASIAVAFILNFAQPFLVPLVIALLIRILIDPIIDYQIDYLHVHRIVAVFVSLCLIVFLFIIIVPFIGSSLGFVPLFLLLLGSGKEILAWTTLSYGLLVISTIDNLIRILFLKSYDNIHPLQTLIGVIIGIPLLGIVGVIIGPILINTLFIMWEIYRKSYWVTSWDRENRTSP